MGSSFLDGLNIFFERSADANATSSKCVSGIDHYEFYQYSLIPSVVILLVLAATTKRRDKLLGVFDGRPGLLIPMDALTRSYRLSYAAAFGSTAMLVYQILLNQQFAINYDGPIALKTLIAILSMVIYGLVFFPIFSSLALGTAMSYGLGTLFIWMFTIVDFYTVSECEYTNAGRTLIVVRNLPSLVCHSYLSISMPIRFFMACRAGVFLSPPDNTNAVSVRDVRNSFQGKHVTKLLKKPKIPDPPQGCISSLKAKVLGILQNWIYHRESGFRYPSRMLSVMVTAGIVVYVITVEFLVWSASVLNQVLDGLEVQLDYIGWDEWPNEEQGVTDYRTGLLVAHYLAVLTRACLIVSIILTSLCSFLTMLHMLSNFRTNLYAMYRGDYRLIPSPSEKSAASLCIGCLKYAGFQVAYITWSFMIVCLILFIISMILGVFITLIIEGYTDWLVNKILQIWPGVVITFAVLIIQMVLAKKVFLQGDGEYLRLNNRRFFFLFTYFMFFYNIFLGLISCLLRIIKAMVVGIIFLARLDNSTLPRKFEFFDPGFSAYQGFIHMEAAHTHPVVITFIQLLKAMRSEHIKEDGESAATTSDTTSVTVTTTTTFGDKDTPPSNGVDLSHIELGTKQDPEKDKTKKGTKMTNYSARFNWWVTYTLLQNPQVRMYRKGYFQALRKARKEGLRMPISDLPISEFDLAKLELDKEKEMEEKLTAAAEEARAAKKSKQTSSSSKENTHGLVPALMRMRNGGSGSGGGGDGGSGLSDKIHDLEEEDEEEDGEKGEEEVVGDGDCDITGKKESEELATRV